MEHDLKAFPSPIAAPPETMVTQNSSSLLANTQTRCSRQPVNTPVASSSRDGRHSRSNRYVARKSTAGLPVRTQVSRVTRKSAVVNQTRPTSVKKKSNIDMAGPSASTASDITINGRQEMQLIGTDKRSPTNFTVKRDVAETVASSCHVSEPIEIDLTSENEEDEELQPPIHQVTQLKFLLIVTFDKFHFHLSGRKYTVKLSNCSGMWKSQNLLRHNSQTFLLLHSNKSKSEVSVRRFPVFIFRRSHKRDF